MVLSAPSFLFGMFLTDGDSGSLENCGSTVLLPQKCKPSRMAWTVFFFKCIYLKVNKSCKHAFLSNPWVYIRTFLKEPFCWRGCAYMHKKVRFAPCKAVQRREGEGRGLRNSRDVLARPRSRSEAPPNSPTRCCSVSEHDIFFFSQSSSCFAEISMSVLLLDRLTAVIAMLCSCWPSMDVTSRASCLHLQCGMYDCQISGIKFLLILFNCN